jgi:hypothetical protein
MPVIVAMFRITFDTHARHFVYQRFFLNFCFPRNFFSWNWQHMVRTVHNRKLKGSIEGFHFSLLFFLHRIIPLIYILLTGYICSFIKTDYVLINLNVLSQDILSYFPCICHIFSFLISKHFILSRDYVVTITLIHYHRQKWVNVPSNWHMSCLIS